MQYLFREFPNQIQRNAVELRVLQQLVQIIGKHLEDQTLVAAIHKVVQEPYDVLFIIMIRRPQRPQQLDLRLRLQREGLLGLDDLYRDVRARALVSCPNNLPEATLAYSLLYGIMFAEGVLHLQFVVVVLVVPLGLGGFRRALLDLPFCFFLVVDLCG